MSNKYFEVVKYGDRLEVGCYYRDEILRYMLRTGKSYAEAVEALKNDNDDLDTISYVLEKIRANDEFKDGKSYNYIFDDLSFNVFLRPVGYTEVGYITKGAPINRFLAEKFYADLQSECLKNDNDWAVMFLEPIDVEKSPYKIQSFSSYEDAENDAEEFTRGDYLRRAYIYSRKEDRIEQTYSWSYKHFPYPWDESKLILDSRKVYRVDGLYKNNRLGGRSFYYEMHIFDK